MFEQTYPTKEEAIDVAFRHLLKIAKLPCQVKFVWQQILEWKEICLVTSDDHSSRYHFYTLVPNIPSEVFGDDIVMVCGDLTVCCNSAGARGFMPSSIKATFDGINRGLMFYEATFLCDGFLFVSQPWTRTYYTGIKGCFECFSEKTRRTHIYNLWSIAR